MEKLTTIKLSGSLARKFGREHKRVIFKTKDAIKALCLTLNGFQKHLSESHKRGVEYAVFCGKKNIGADELEFSNNGSEIRIVPVISGHKSGGLFQTLLGVALIGISFAFGGAGGILSAEIASGMLLAGTSLAIGGVMQMLFPQKTGNIDTSDSENKPSYAFGSVVNTTSQGLNVPLLYGRRLVGGAVISAAILAEDQE